MRRAAAVLLALASTGLLAWLVAGRPALFGTAPASDAEVRAACAHCHAFPEPGILPRSAWRQQIEYMAYLRDYLPERLTGATPAFSVDAIHAWYEAHAPEALPEPRNATVDAALPLQLERRFVVLGRESGPGVATVQRLDGDGRTATAPLLATANMLLGSVHLLSRAGGPVFVGNAGHPVRVLAGDVDGDAREDLVISDLGNPMPSDDLVGRVLVARRLGEREFALEAVAEGLPRVADARPFDLDADGDLDILVAAFGWLRAGGIYVLWNETPPGGALRFRRETVIERPGAVSLIPVARLWPEAGRGFAVAFSQQYEQVSFFSADAAGFHERVLYRAPHPNWGVDNLEIVDLDGDGDADFLLAHGDTLDDGIAFKPYHGVEWLENLGAGEFAAREIGALYGAHRAEAADLDGDGDLDVVACGFLPQVQLPTPQGALQVPSLIWFERQAAGWTARAVEVNHPRHTGMTLADLDGDGRPDIVAAINLAWDAQKPERGPSLEVWFNRGPP